MSARLVALALALGACTEPAVIGRHGDGATPAGGGPGEDIAWDATVDPDGNAYVVGVFETEITFGSETHVAGPSGLGAFIVSFDRGGAYRWSRAWSASRFTYVGHVAVRGERVYVLGYASGQLTTGAGSVDAGELQDLVLLFFDRAGGEVAPPYSVGSAAGNAQGKAIDATEGRLAIVGHYVGDVDLGSGLLGDTGGPVDFGMLGVLDGEGALRWAHNLDGADILLEATALAGDGGLYTTGHYRDGAVLGSPSQGEWDGLLLAHDPDGALRWSVVVGTPGLDRVDAISIAPDGDVVVGGVVSGDLDLGDGRSAARGDGDGFVARFGADGALRWTRRVGGPGLDIVSSVAVAPDGEIVAAGIFGDTAEVAGVSLTSRGGSDVMVFGLRPDGSDAGWAVRRGGPGLDDAFGVEVDGDEVVVAGRFSDDADFGAQRLRSAGETDVFLHRFVP